MKSLIKKSIFWLLVVCGIWATRAVAPSFDNNFAKYLTDTTPDEYGRVETVFKICIDRELSLMENVRNLFYPWQVISDIDCTSSKWWQLRDVINVLSMAILFLFIVLAWVKFVMGANEPDGAKKAAMSIVYIWYWAFLIFGVIWILWSVLNIWWIQWTGQLVDAIQNNLFLQILSFFKILAFFIAIIMIVVYGFQIMAAMDKSDKIKVAQKWIMNVIIALVLIKVIDYVFYMAQLPEFGAKAADMIISVSKILWFIIGAAFVVAIFYAWFLLLTSWGKEETFKKAKWFIVNILIVSVVLFLFLLIVYQIFNEFA